MLCRIAWFWTTLAIGASSAIAEAQAGVASFDELDSLSDSELHAICTNLGFDLVDKDPNTGEPMTFTHEDYVEAARQCLTVQQEMEEILAENPDLMEEFLDERDRMEKENERLLREKERLEAELAEAESDSDEARAAFVSRNSLKEDNKSGGTEAILSEPSVGQPREGKLESDNQETLQEEVSSIGDNSDSQSVSPDAEDVAPEIDDAPSNEQQQVQQQQQQQQQQKGIVEVLDQIFPKPLRAILRKVLVRVKKDGMQLLLFVRRQLDAILGHIAKRIEERKDAAQPVGSPSESRAMA